VAGIPVEALAYSTGNTDVEGGVPADLEVAAQVPSLSIAPGAEFTVTDQHWIARPLWTRGVWDLLTTGVKA
jgi:hypothetical protein